ALVDLGHATKEKVSGVFYFEAIKESEPTIKLEATLTPDELAVWFTTNFDPDHAKLLQPGRDIPSIVVLVEAQTGTKPSTIERIVPGEPTIQPIVPNIDTDGNTTITVDELNTVYLAITQEAKPGGVAHVTKIRHRVQDKIKDPARLAIAMGVLFKRGRI